MTAYEQVKVWEIEEAKPRPVRPARPSSPPRPPSPPRPIRPRSPATDSRAVRPEDVKERAERNERLWVWARLSVVVMLGAAVLWWPYGRSCGFSLAAYLLAPTMIIVGGLWVVVCTWSRRMARTHGLAMLVALWGAGLIAAEILPRIGYAAQPAVWLCRNAPPGTP